MVDLIERIQAYLRHDYEDQEMVEAGLVNVYFGTTEAKPEFNLAVPTQRTVDNGDALLPMEDAFWQHHLSPRVQFLDAYNPSLTALLGKNGYELVREDMVLACTPKSRSLRRAAMTSTTASPSG